MRLYVTSAREPYPPALIRGAMLHLMTRCGPDEPVRLRAFQGEDSITYNAFVGRNTDPIVRVVNAAVEIVRG